MPMVELLRRLPSIIDDRRWQVEIEAQRKYTRGVHEDDLLEAVHRWVIDLLDAGHTPSRDMLRLISGELKAAWWPDRKQRQHSKERAWLNHECCLIDYWWKKQYGKAHGTREKAEQDVAEMNGLTLENARRRRTRFRARLKKRKAALERQRKRPLRK
jgi:hypothetical protein